MMEQPAQDNNVALLNEIYLNSKMGAAAVDALLAKVEDSTFATELQTMLTRQQAMAGQAATELRSRAQVPSQSSVFAKAGLWSTIQLHMLGNRDNDHIAELMIQGDTMGLINLTRALRTFSEADPKIAEMATAAIAQEQDSIERMKKFL